MKPPTRTRNVMPNKAWCAHCDQAGLVMLDEERQHANSVTAPCPMCEAGRVLEDSQWGVSGFWSRPGLDSLRDVGAVSWNRGLTFQMRDRCQVREAAAGQFCGLPTVGRECAFHAVEANRQPGAWQRGSAEFGAVLAGFSFGTVPSGGSDDELVAADVERGRFVRGQREARGSDAADRAVSWDGVEA